MMKRKALGRGLNALLPETIKAKDEVLIDIDINQIIPNPYQPRTILRDDKLEELAASIRENGVVQPVLVKKLGTRYQLIAGERRWRAAQIANLIKIPAVILNVPDEKMLELALIENIQREDLNAIEEALAYQKMIDVLGLKQEEVAKRVGKERSSVANALRLLNLPDRVKALVADGELSVGHAKVLLSVETEATQVKLAEQVIERGLSVRQCEELARHVAQKPAIETTLPTSKMQDPNTRAAEDRLRIRLGTKVTIKRGGLGGKIEIDFYSEDDLQRIYAIIIGEQAAAAGQ